jgi:hypothetical protein
MLRNLEKHKKYQVAYKPNDFYWGLGVEHETYIESSKLKQVSLRGLKENCAPERYSVDYYNVYNRQQLHKALDGMFTDDEKILLPILANSHTFQRTDLNGEHDTTYERIPKPNPKFTGKTVFEWMKEQNPIFATEYEKSYIFDGDTIEFMTQNFYKTTVDKTIEELVKTEADLLNALNALPKEGLLKTYGPFQLAQKNYGFATYLTNLKHNAMFNNGTMHVNITLPTELDEKGEIKDIALFTKQHQDYARAIQWISPLIVAAYGAFDPLCESRTNGEQYAAGSQRLAVSRYIGLGTYDTDIMEVGKILTRHKDKLKHLDWYEEFHKKADYRFLDELGLDLNFNKHYSHGIEFRILESISPSDLKDVMELLVYLADFSLANELPNPIKSKTWHLITSNCVMNGRGYYIDVTSQNELYETLQIPELAKEPRPITEVLDIIRGYLFKTYANGTCVKCMIRGEDIQRVLPEPQPAPEPQLAPEPASEPQPTPEPLKESPTLVQPGPRQPVPIVSPPKKGRRRWWCCRSC